MAENSIDLLKLIGSNSKDASEWLQQTKLSHMATVAQNAQMLQASIAGGTQGAVSGRKGATQGSDAFDMFMKAIAQQESGGNYKATGTPVDGDMAYGKYQIMGNNIPSWTQQALGVSMTPQEFLKSKSAQDTTAEHYLWNYYKNYGPKQAAMAWNQGVAGMESGYGKSYGHDIMERMRAYGYTRGAPSHTNPDGSVTPGSGWVSPIQGMNNPTSNYGMRTNPVSGNRSFHEGVDYGAATGTRVGAAHGGEIVESGWDPVYGNRVIMETPKGKQILYGHMNKINPKWDVGETVQAGQRLGQVGSTGWSTGPHLHFGIYDQSMDNPINPMGIISRMGQGGRPGSPNGSPGPTSGGGGPPPQYNYGNKKQAPGITNNPSDKFNSILRDIGL